MSNRLGNDNYVRPKKTLQDKLSKEEQAEKLIGYLPINDVEHLKEIPLGTEIRYFIYTKEGKNVSKKFRLGGKLINKDNADKYIVLATGLPPQQKTWSVQTKDAEMFYKQKVEDVIQATGFHKEEISELKDEIKKLKEERNQIIIKYNLLVDKYEILKKKDSKPHTESKHKAVTESKHKK
jgi:hypothetical protein